VWESLVLLVAETLITLGGPVLVAQFREKRLPRAQQKRLDQLLTATGELSSGHALPLASALQAAGVTSAQNRTLLDFLKAPEGAMLLRYVAMESIVTNQSSRKVVQALTAEARALFLLYSGVRPQFVDHAAAVLVESLRDTTIEIYRLIQTQSPQVARDIAEQASRLRASSPLLEPGIDRRSHTRTRALKSRLSTDVEHSVVEYAEALARDSSTTAIPSLRGEVRVPLPEILLEREIRDVHDKQLVAHSLLTWLTRCSQVVLLGDPGQGKSTAVLEAVAALAGRVSDGRLDAVPVKVTLRHYAREVERTPTLGLSRYICQSIQGDLSIELEPEILEYLLDLGRCVVFFDGLDEVLSIPARREIVKRIESFSSAHPLNAYVVTSRTTDYVDAPLAAHFQRGELTTLTPSQVELFATNFFRYMEGSPDRKSAREFLEQTEPLADLRANPLMLGVLCNLYSLGRRMPTNRYDLYKRCAEMLFGDWDAGRGIASSVDDEINTERAVRELALEVFQSGEEEFREPWLRAFLRTYHRQLPGSNDFIARQFSDNALALWRGRRWLIVSLGIDRGDEVYRFSHRTFLEFFASEQFIYNSRTGAELFSALERYIREATAINFCLLCADAYFRESLHAAGDFLTALLAAAALEGADPDAKRRLLAFGLRCLPFADRAGNDVRLNVTREYSRNSAAAIQLHSPARGFPAELDGTPEREHTLIVWAACEGFGSLGNLKPGDLDLHIDAAAQGLRAATTEDSRAGLGALVALWFGCWEAPQSEVNARLLVVLRSMLQEFRSRDVKPLGPVESASVAGALALGAKLDVEWTRNLAWNSVYSPVSSLGRRPDHKVSLGWLVLGRILGWDWGDRLTVGVTLDVGPLLDPLREFVLAGEQPKLTADSPKDLFPMPTAVRGRSLASDERYVAIGLLGQLCRVRPELLSDLPWTGGRASDRLVYETVQSVVSLSRRVDDTDFDDAFRRVEPSLGRRRALARFWGVHVVDTEKKAAKKKSSGEDAGTPEGRAG